MISSEHPDLKYASRLSDMLILIRFQLRQEHNEIYKKVNSLKGWGKEEWQPVSKFENIQ